MLRAGPGLTVPCRRTFAPALQASAALGETLPSPSWLRSVFYAGSTTRSAPSLGYRLRMDASLEERAAAGGPPRPPGPWMARRP